MLGTETSGRFPVHLIKPSHYDDDGYVIQWLRSTIPSNSLATLCTVSYATCRRAACAGLLTSLSTCHAIDETNTRVRVERIIRDIRRGMDERRRNDRRAVEPVPARRSIWRAGSAPAASRC